MDTRINLHRFDANVRDLEDRLTTNPPEPGGILFYGSSTMTQWRVDDLCYRQMAPLPLTNTGFGGSTAEEALYYYHRLVLPARPSILTYYEGANDLNSGYSPEEVVATTHRVFEWARQDFPSIQFVLLPIKLCPALENIMQEAKRCNRLFEAYTADHEDTHLLDLNSFLYNSEGQYRTEIYIEDGLHHNPQGYRELAAILKPVLERLYNARPHI